MFFFKDATIRHTLDLSLVEDFVSLNAVSICVNLIDVTPERLNRDIIVGVTTLDITATSKLVKYVLSLEY